MIRALFFFAAILALPGLAQSNEELLLQHEITVRAQISARLSRGEIIPLVSVRGEGAARYRGAPFLDLVRYRTKALGIRSKLFRGDFAASFKNQELSLPDLLSPKLLVDVNIGPVNREGTLRMESSVVLIDYRAQRGDRATPSVVFVRRQDSTGISADGVEEIVAKFLQQELSSSEFSAAGRAYGNVPAADRSNPETYSLHWNDPDRERNHLLLGATVGTPALFNLFVGYWGSKALPLTAGLSGMAFDDENGGAQLDVGYAFDNEGDLKQAICASLTFFNEKVSTSSDQTNSLGQIISTTTSTINTLRAFLGPSYVLQVKGLRAQLGATYRLESAAQSEIRVIFQLGYTLPVAGF